MQQKLNNKWMKTFTSEKFLNLSHIYTCTSFIFFAYYSAYYIAYILYSHIIGTLCSMLCSALHSVLVMRHTLVLQWTSVLQIWEEGYCVKDKHLQAHPCMILWNNPIWLHLLHAHCSNTSTFNTVCTCTCKRGYANNIPSLLSSAIWVTKDLEQKLLCNMLNHQYNKEYALSLNRFPQILPMECRGLQAIHKNYKLSDHTGLCNTQFVGNVKGNDQLFHCRWHTIHLHLIMWRVQYKENWRGYH